MELNWRELKDMPFSQFSVMSSEISCIFCLLQSNNMEAYVSIVMGTYVVSLTTKTSVKIVCASQYR